MQAQYTAIAQYYDRLNGADYDAHCDFLQAMMAEYGLRKTQGTQEHLVLDLACGTGAISHRMAERGYEVIGVDFSQEMLACARENDPASRILYLQQDMRAFELYGTVDAAFCCLDSINYLLQTEDVHKTFACVHNYLNPNGLFLFDVHTPYCLEQYGKSDFVMEEEEVLLAWQNSYCEKSKICTFYLSFFAEQADGTYRRTDELQKERAYSHRTLSRLLKEAGLELIAHYGSTDRTAPTETDLRHYYVCRCVKNEQGAI